LKAKVVIRITSLVCVRDFVSPNRVRR
jgi:hypothetical protein